MESVELLVRKNALKDMELWVVQQIADVDTRLAEIEKEKANA